MHKRTIQGAVALVILWGLLALLGWHFNVPLLKSGLTGSPIPMKANTAFCLVLCGIALVILQYQRLPPIWIKIAQGIALCVVVVGGLALSQSLWDWDLGIDGWLYPVQNSSTDALIPHPHRMGQNSALNFILIGFALLLFPQKTRCSNWLGQILSCIATIVAMTALVGHLFVTNVNYILVYGAVNMAPSTAMIFLLLCIGLLLTRPYRGLMQPLSSPLLGGMLARQTLPWAIVMPIGLGWLVRQGEKLGWYDSAFSDVIDVIVLMVGFSILVWWNARLLNRSEVHRLQIETDLRQTHESRNRANERNATFSKKPSALPRSLIVSEALPSTVLT